MEVVKIVNKNLNKEIKDSSKASELAAKYPLFLLEAVLDLKNDKEGI